MALKYVTIAVVALICVEALSALSLAKRSLASTASANASAEGTAETKEVCQGRTPCGWAVYNKMTRYIDYFMRNKCECSKEKKCLRDDDDISITAYVYRCKIDDSSKTTS
ncbi:hypothetical protein MTP99_016292 [Tenebrio molitor]|uniref:uncharacterized protein n=1 Tax=Tenebrio molitor TaxID=7067 RepID=UPI001C3A3A89|nr:hypothetical protein MTP99_016292 [Tenebrio molitor]CAH1374916.1 unnamed protein product [Tenebrio molitor]